MIKKDQADMKAFQAFLLSLSPTWYTLVYTSGITLGTLEKGVSSSATMFND